MSSKRLVAADDENIFIIVIGTSSEGKLNKDTTGLIKLIIIVNNPDVLIMPIATINPTKVGIKSTTIFNPSLAPLTNASNISTRFYIPVITI
jgi:hypothetical protein